MAAFLGSEYKGAESLFEDPSQQPHATANYERKEIIRAGHKIYIPFLSLFLVKSGSCTSVRESDRESQRALCDALKRKEEVVLSVSSQIVFLEGNEGIWYTVPGMENYVNL